MSKKKGGFKELLYGVIMPKVYGIGASIVILGAMFKLLHLPGAALMLGLGMSVEALIFLLSAFEPQKHEVDWTKVYPELAEDYRGAGVPNRAIGSGDSVSQKLDTVLSKKIGPELVDSLGLGMQRLADTTSKLSKMGDASVSTQEYTTQVKAAADNIGKMNKTYSESVDSMNKMAQMSKSATDEMSKSAADAKEYHTQVQQVTKNLSALNAVYEMELNDANSHVKAMNKFYANVTKAMDSMAQASQDTDKFKSEINKLTNNLVSLNNIYGGMINAMKA